MDGVDGDVSLTPRGRTLERVDALGRLQVPVLERELQQSNNINRLSGMGKEYNKLTKLSQD